MNKWTEWLEILEDIESRLEEALRQQGLDSEYVRKLEHRRVNCLSGIVQELLMEKAKAEEGKTE